MTAPGAADRRGPSADRRDRRRPRAGLRRAAAARHRALVLRRLGADPLRHRDRQLRHLERPARPRRREPRRSPGCATSRRSTRSSPREICGARVVKLVTFETADGVRRAGAARRRARSSRSTCPTCARSSSAASTRRRAARRRARRARRRAPARADHPEEVLPHLRQLPRARGGVEGRRLVARDRAVDRLLPERRRDHRPRRADHLPRAPDRRARPRARARRDHRQGRASTSTRDEAAVLHRRLHDLQRHHRARHPAPRDALGRVLLLQGDRHLLPARPVDRHPRRGRRPARPRRCACASTASCARSPTRATCR